MLFNCTPVAIMNVFSLICRPTFGETPEVTIIYPSWDIDKLFVVGKKKNYYMKSFIIYLFESHDCGLHNKNILFLKSDTEKIELIQIIKKSKIYFPNSIQLYVIFFVLCDMFFCHFKMHKLVSYAFLYKNVSIKLHYHVSDCSVFRII